jgi:hypothetical protein
MAVTEPTDHCHIYPDPRYCVQYANVRFRAEGPSDPVSTTGELKTFEHAGGSGRLVYRRFCPNCGSGVVNIDPHAGLTIVLAGTLDDPTVFAPPMEFCCSSAQSWTQTASERTQFPEMPS